MAKRYYRPELDALRFFAFACVFCDHMPINASHQRLRAMQEPGAFGMCIFFMLSAYLITNILLRERDVTGTVSWKAFAVRRILRIWPLYFAVLFIGYTLGLYLPITRVSGRALIAFSILLGNIFVAHYGWVLGAVNPLWSISVEEQFYLTVPIMARTCSRRTMAWICVATIFVAYVVLLRLGARGAIPVVGVWTNSFVQFQFFAAGALVALWLHNDELSLSLASRGCLATAGLGLWFVANFRFHLRSPLPAGADGGQLVWGYILVLLGTALIFIAALDIKVQIPRSITYLGKVSYGLYLFHGLFLYLILFTSNVWPPMLYFQQHMGVAASLILGLTIGTAAISYSFFERPILKFKERFETIRTRPA